jgi:hypothetical protein
MRNSKISALPIILRFNVTINVLVITILSNWLKRYHCSNICTSKAEPLQAEREDICCNVNVQGAESSAGAEMGDGIVNSFICSENKTLCCRM